MDLKIDASTLVLGAFSKALSEVPPEEIAAVMAATLLEKADKNSYATNAETVLDRLVRSAVDTLARQVVNEVVGLYRPLIEEQVRAQVAGRTVEVQLLSGYDREGIKVSVQLGEPAVTGAGEP